MFGDMTENMGVKWREEEERGGNSGKTQVKALNIFHLDLICTMYDI